MHSVNEFELTKGTNYIEVSNDTMLYKQISYIMNAYHSYEAGMATIKIVVNTNGILKFKDKSSFMKIKKMSSPVSILANCDYIIIINYGFYEQLSELQQLALLDDTLSKIEITENENTGVIKFKLKNPDMREFYDVIKRHGAYTDELKIFMNTLSKTLTNNKDIQNEK